MCRIKSYYIYICRGGEFRKDFGKIGDLLLSTFPELPVMVFTATASPKAQHLIKTLRLRNPKQVIRNPDRVNIKYEKVFRPPSQDTEDHLEEILKPMADELASQKLDYPLTVMYTDTNVIAFCYALMEKQEAHGP